MSVRRNSAGHRWDKQEGSKANFAWIQKGRMIEKLCCRHEQEKAPVKAGAFFIGAEGFEVASNPCGTQNLFSLRSKF